MLDLESAIKHCEEVAEELEKRVKPYQCESINKKLYEINKKEWDSCLECAKEHRQLAEWLRELKKYRAIFEKVGKILADNGYIMDDLDNIFRKANDEEVNADADSD